MVQCKYWSQKKTIREKHISQLFGTTKKYEQEHPDEDVTPVLYTSTILSEKAIEFAQHLGVQIQASIPLPRVYPIIKCVEGDEKIYHLPFDQQYDKIRAQRKGRFYLATVAEAEQAGFRRAYRWKGRTS